MAVVTTGKSTAITNATATPRVLNTTGLAGGQVQRSIGFVTLANGDSATSIYRVARLPSNCYVDAIKLTCLDIGTTGTADIGLYYPTTHSNGGTVIDVDAFASAINFHGGSIDVDVDYDSGAAAGLITNAEKRLWERAGLTSDPGGEFDLVLGLAADTDAAGTILVRVYFVC